MSDANGSDTNEERLGRTLTVWRAASMAAGRGRLGDADALLDSSWRDDAADLFERGPALRDLLILTVNDPQLMDEGMIGTAAADPHSPVVVRLMDRVCRRGWDDTDPEGYFRRMDWAADQLESMADSSPAASRETRADMLAAAAHIHWYAGDGPEADRVARRALDTDEHNVLSALVAGAVRAGWFFGDSDRARVTFAQPFVGDPSDPMAIAMRGSAASAMAL